MSKSRTQKAQETRRAILKAARKRFSLDGYEASISSIVIEAGITKGALFHHFENKQQLYYEVWRDLQVSMDADTRQAAAGVVDDPDPYAGFLAGARVYFDWVTRQDYQRIVLLEGPRALGLAQWYEADHNLGQKNVRAGIRRLVEAGRIAEADADAMAVLVQGALNGAGFALARKEYGLTPDAMLKAFAAMLRSLQ